MNLRNAVEVLDNARGQLWQCLTKSFDSSASLQVHCLTLGAFVGQTISSLNYSQ